MDKILEFFGIGRIKGFSGTVASVAAFPILYFLKGLLGWYFYTLLFMVFLIYSIKICVDAGKIEGDSKRIVIDEVVGLAAMFIFEGGASNLWKRLIGLVIFRVLDILKPWPVSYWQKEESFVGIVGDDLIAGIIAGVAISLI